MKEYDHPNEAENAREFTVTSPFNQLALSNALYLHMDNYSTIVNETTPDEMLKKRAVSFRVAQKLVGGFVNHHTEWRHFCPPDMTHWEILGMPQTGAIDLPAYLEADGSHVFGSPQPEFAVFDDPEDIALLYEVCHEYLVAATLLELGGGRLHMQVMEYCVLPLRSMIDELAVAHGVDADVELKAGWGIRPEHELSTDDLEFLRKLEERPNSS